MKPRSKTKIKVFLIDDHPVVREGVRSYLRGKSSIAMVGEAADDKEALRKLRKLSPDVIILDINLPAMDGGELARRLRLSVPGAKLIAFSIHVGQEYVIRMARSGAHGYVTKDAPTDDLLKAIHRVHEGGLAFPAGMGDALLAPGVRPPPDESRPALTAREREVLVLLADGLANKQVARKLGISVRTVETHREHLSRKLGIASVAGLTKYAIQHGLTPLRIEDAAPR